jgi:prepilin-type N-terminal cleavage/methylation domain-containing protein
MKKGFTLGEMVVAMAITAIICAMTIPVVTRSLVKQHKDAYKAAFKNVESVVDEMITDTSLYPGGEFTNGADFCSKFFDKANTIGASNCAAAPTIPTTPNFVTLNGMKWYFPGAGAIGTFNSACPDDVGNNCLLIYVDINGGKGKNTNTGDNAQRDILGVYVSKTGKVYTPEDTDGPERSYLTN